MVRPGHKTVYTRMVGSRWRALARGFRAPSLRLLAVLAPLAGAGGCGDDATGPLVGAELSLASGDGQRGVAGVELPLALTVSLQDAGGEPLAGISVSWAVTAGGATLSRGASSTGSDGLASVAVTPVEPGLIEVTASLAEVGEVVFGAIGLVALDDPGGDTFESELSQGLVAPDVVRMGAWPEGESLVVELEFAEAVVSNRTGGPNAIIGFLDIDADQDFDTGIPAFTDIYNPGGPATGMGVDFFVELTVGATGTMSVGNANFTPVGSFLPTFAGNVLTLRIPLVVLGGDDGRVDLAAVVGTPQEPTDVVPDLGSLSLGPSPASATPSSSPAAIPGSSTWSGARGGRGRRVDPGGAP